MTGYRVFQHPVQPAMCWTITPNAIYSRGVRILDSTSLCPLLTAPHHVSRSPRVRSGTSRRRRHDRGASAGCPEQHFSQSSQAIHSLASYARLPMAQVRRRGNQPPKVPRSVDFLFEPAQAGHILQDLRPGTRLLGGDDTRDGYLACSALVTGGVWKFARAAWL